jgi:hypothetical protein
VQNGDAPDISPRYFKKKNTYMSETGIGLLGRGDENVRTISGEERDKTYKLAV